MVSWSFFSFGTIVITIKLSEGMRFKNYLKLCMKELSSTCFECRKMISIHITFDFNRDDY